MIRAQAVTVVILAPVEWHFSWQSAQTMATGLAELGYQVLYVNPFPKRMPALTEFWRVVARLTGWRPRKASRQPIQPGVCVIDPMALPDVHGVLEHINRLHFVPRVARRLRSLIARRQLVVVTYLPFATPLALVRALDPELLVYACQGNWAADLYAAQATLQEEELFSLARTGMVLADSDYLYEHATRYHRCVRRWPAMVDWRLFSRLAKERPPASQEGKMLCCYFGTVGPRVDVDLLAQVSRSHKLRIVGTVRTPRSLVGCSRETEVLGPVPHTALPGLLRDVDVFLFPYRIDEFIKGVVPAKLFECFATGNPVVSTCLPSLAGYSGLVYLSSSRDEFMANIERARHEPPERREQRIRLARENSTEHWMNELNTWILDGLTERSEENSSNIGKVASFRNG